MTQQQLLLGISTYLARFREEVKIQNANGEFSINIHAENVLIKVLNIIYDYEFKNLNYKKGKNYDSIDLGDIQGQMSVQVTATKSLKKVIETLEKFVQNEHYKNYASVKLLVLTGRQEKYGSERIEKVIHGRFQFNQASDIIDLSTIYVKINQQNDLSKMLAIHELLREQFTDIVPPTSSLDTIDSYDKLKMWLSEKLRETNEIFERFGPNTHKDGQEPPRWDLSLWYAARREKIVPLNAVIADTIRNYFDLIPKDDRPIFNKYLAHVYAFEKHCEDADLDYSEHQFPSELNNIIYGN